MHSEVKIELIILTCELLKKIKCFRSLKFLDSDYINHLRYTQSETKNILLSFFQFRLSHLTSPVPLKTGRCPRGRDEKCSLQSIKNKCSGQHQWHFSRPIVIFNGDP